MAKKCISVGGGSLVCVENMTLFVLVLLSISVGYLYYMQFKPPAASSAGGFSQTSRQPYVYAVPGSTSDDLQNIYAPPLKTIDVRGSIELPQSAAPILGVGIPVNIRTSTANTPYRQIGILTKNVRNLMRGGGSDDPIILPLFGRNLLNGRDKWQYYTMSNSGGATFNAKLPISVNGRSCTGEYGCDGVYNGDTVYVEGYEDTFRATIYENASLNYIPF